MGMTYDPRSGQDEDGEPVGGGHEQTRNAVDEHDGGPDQADENAEGAGERAVAENGGRATVGCPFDGLDGEGEGDDAEDDLKGAGGERGNHVCVGLVVRRNLLVDVVDDERGEKASEVDMRQRLSGIGGAQGNRGVRDQVADRAITGERESCEKDAVEIGGLPSIFYLLWTTRKRRVY